MERIAVVAGEPQREVLAVIAAKNGKMISCSV
jgi:hypothetical protein